MNSRSLVVVMLMVFFQAPICVSQKLVVDTVARKYYIKYEVNDSSELKDGSYEMLFRGKSLTKGSYKNGNRTGAWQFIQMNDTLQQEGSYVDGKRDGEWKFYSSDGKLSCIMPYTRGKKDGVFKGFFLGGNLAFEKKYVNDSIVGVSTEYYQNGKVKETATYQGDTLDGLVKSYYDNGSLDVERNMKGWRKEGDYFSYFDNGILREHFVYVKGSPYNAIASNDKDGKPTSGTTLKEGNGVLKLYDRNGNITSEETYKNSVQEGYARYWRKGILTKEGKYVNGKYDSVWINNFPTGELNSKINFKDGKAQGEALYYFMSGGLSQKGQYSNDEKSGPWVNYDEKGDVASELNFKNDLMDGEAKYYDNGKVWRTGKYNKGVKIYIWTDYDKRGKEVSVKDYGYTFVTKDDIKKGKPDAPKDKPPVLAEEDLEAPLSIVEKMPSFPGGERMMMEFIQENVKYPQMEMESGIQGTVYITFVVDNVGEIEDVKILRGVSGGPGCDKEGIRVVKSMPRWSPGVQNGRPVRVQFNLPLKFRFR